MAKSRLTSDIVNSRITDMHTFQQHALPDWVHWLAQDADGTWWGFEVEPNQSHLGWYENELGRYIRLASDIPNPLWEQTLSQVHSNQASSKQIST